MKRSRFALLLAYACWRILKIFTLLFLNFLLHPTKLFVKRKPYVRPLCLRDQSLGIHNFIMVNGIKIHYVISGPEKAPVMLMLHGFPEFWYSWRFQIREFYKDFRVIALDLRGYGESDKPAEKSIYTIPNAVDDVIELLRLLGITKCTLLAHDWGGIFGWRVVLKRPDLIENFVVMSCPHPGRYKDLINVENDSLFRQWYVIFHQLPWIPEQIMTMEDFRSFKSLFKSRRYGFVNRDKFTDEDLQAFLYMFSQPYSLTGPVNYFRNLLGDPLLQDGIVYDKINVPTLILFGENDAFLSTEMADGHEKYVEHVECKILLSGHWIQQDTPGEVNSAIRVFLSQC